MSFDVGHLRRKLLICTKDMGQANSNRRKLKRSLSKQRAGIPLNSNEIDLLFTKKNTKAASVEEPKHMGGDDTLASHSVVSCSIPTPELVSTTTSTCTKPSTLSLTRKIPNLLQQFENIKARGGCLSTDENIFSMSGSANHSETLSSNNCSVDRSPHLPIQTVIPISDQGRVTCSLQQQLQQQHYKNIRKKHENCKSSGPFFLSRDPLIQENRLKLPICGMEQEIVEAISANDVIILCGETGSGKSTQVMSIILCS